MEKPNDDIDNLENNEIIDVPDENDTIPAAFYEVIDDIQLVALDFVDDMFSSLEQTEQTIAFKEFMVSYINNVTDKVERELGVDGIELGLRKVSYIYNSVDAQNAPIQLFTNFKCYVECGE